MSGSVETASCRFTKDEIRRKVNELGEWFHNIDLCGIKTAPNHFLGDYPSAKWKRFAHAIPADLTGKTVLDIGCNGGFYSIEMKKRGAGRVVGIDSDNAFLDQARFAAQVQGLDIEFRKMSVYEVAGIGERFDLVFFMGVFYHLRHPLLALDLIHDYVAGDLFVFQSMLRGSTEHIALASDYPFSETEVFQKPEFPLMYFIENSYSGDPTNWWIPNKACVVALLRNAGFEIVANPEEEVFTCRRVDTEGWVGKTMEAALPGVR